MSREKPCLSLSWSKLGTLSFAHLALRAHMRACACSQRRRSLEGGREGGALPTGLTCLPERLPCALAFPMSAARALRAMAHGSSGAA